MKNARNSSGRWASALKTFGKKPPLKKESRHVVSVVTRTKATQTKFWDKFSNQPITSRDLNDEIMHNCTKMASSKYVANHFCKRIWKIRNHYCWQCMGFAESKASGKKNWSNLRQPLILFHRRLCSRSESQCLWLEKVWGRVQYIVYAPAQLGRRKQNWEWL